MLVRCIFLLLYKDAEFWVILYSELTFAGYDRGARIANFLLVNEHFANFHLWDRAHVHNNSTKLHADD